MTTTMGMIPLVASVASLSLAVTAIALSIVFYRMSTDLMEKSRDAANRIGGSVERLEGLFDRLYSDTFSVMKDTVTDMRRQLWPDKSLAEDKGVEEAEQRADERVATLRAEMNAEVSSILERQRFAEGQVESLRSEMTQVVDRAIVQSRAMEIESREEVIGAHIVRLLAAVAARGNVVTAGDIMAQLYGRHGFDPVLAELSRMRERGGIVVVPNTPIGQDSVVVLAGPTGPTGPTGPEQEKAGL